jgi:hypothetical protein
MMQQESQNKNKKSKQCGTRITTHAQGSRRRRCFTDRRQGGDQEARLKARKQVLTEAKRRQSNTQRELKDFKPRLKFLPKLPTSSSVLLSILVSSERKLGSALRA